MPLGKEYAKNVEPSKSHKYSWKGERKKGIDISKDISKGFRQNESNQSKISINQLFSQFLPSLVI